MTTMEGPLSKWTNVMKGWQYRWFVLDDNAGLLSYYTSKEKMMRGARRGCVRLKGAVIGIDDEDDSTFTITVDQKIFHFQARDADERERWIRALEDTILRHAQPSRMTWEAMCIGCRRRAQMQKWDSRPSPSLGDLNKKLTETDTYLQMLIDQVKKIEQKIEKIEDGSLKDRSNDVKVSANLLLESIKHSIVLLQIAKNTAHPINGIFQPNLESAPDNAAIAQLEETEKVSSNVSNAHHLDLAITKNLGGTISSGVTVGGSFDDCISQTLSNLSSSHDDLVPGSGVVSHHLGPTPLTTQITQHLIIVPEVSYSSSEDDENFYDANDYEGSPTHQSRSTSSPLSLQDASEGIMPCRREYESKQLMAQVDPSNIDYDVLYEDDDEDELESLEQHGSIISHLLSQVKLGMDLTKVVLPTFILERRSLLEMYADFFAHPDLFCSIVDFADPKDRMIQVVRWYLSAFHAGRKSTVAKKPYNPILGEIFRCRYNWDSQELTNKEENSELVTDGPVPWATKNELAFISEQVSHHPPISAFYAEHYNKRISLDAHIWTKSKFLGLSIGVHMIGQGCISILDYEEEYIISFPNGYGRSILTVPWVELGGKVNLSCAKTGYSANIDFVTKPFYGGKKHRISAEIFAPNEKKSFVIITGEWNGVMVAKYDTGMTEVFVDTRNTPIIKKIVQPVTQQEDYESRRLWKNVTLNLKVKDVEKATAVKYSLEQCQREEAKERLEKKVKWDTRYFHEVGEHWIFDRPLLKRHSWTIASKQT